MGVPKKAGKPPDIVCNHFVKLWLLRRVPAEFTNSRYLHNYPSWVDDVITGAVRLKASVADNTKPLHRGILLGLLCGLSVLSTANVQEWLNNRKHQFNKRHANRYTRAAMSASKSIEHYLERLEQGIPMVDYRDKTALTQKTALPIAPCEPVAA